MLKPSSRPSTLPRLLRGGAALALLAAGVALAQESTSRSFLFMGDFNSRYNREIWWMSIPAIIMSVLIFAGTAWALFYSVFKFRERPGDTREPSQFHGNNVVEISLIAVPLAIVTVLAVLTVRTMARTNPLPPNLARVDALGAQFWWNFSYPKNGSFINGNEMVVPAGRAIAVELTARDVIHGFWAPNLGGQRAAIPGSKKLWTVDTSQPGAYQGNCSQLCGPSHANMRFKVVALKPADWTAFAAAASAYKAPAPTTASEKRGYQIFMNGKNGSASCAGCHRIQGTPAAGQAGPDLSFFGSRYTLGAGMWEGAAARAKLKPWILNSPGLKPGSLMPSFKGQLSGQDLDDLAAYLRSLKLPPQADYWSKVSSVTVNGQ